MLFILIKYPSEIDRIIEGYFWDGYIELLLLAPLMFLAGFVRYCHLSGLEKRDGQRLKQSPSILCESMVTWNDLEKCEVSSTSCALNEKGFLKREVKSAMNPLERDTCLKVYGKIYVPLACVYFILMGVSCWVDGVGF